MTDESHYLVLKLIHPQPGKEIIPIEKRLERPLLHPRKHNVDRPSRHGDRSLVKGTAEYDGEKKRLDAELDEYQESYPSNSRQPCLDYSSLYPPDLFKHPSEKAEERRVEKKLFFGCMPLRGRSMEKTYFNPLKTDTVMTAETKEDDNDPCPCGMDGREYSSDSRTNDLVLDFDALYPSIMASDAYLKSKGLKPSQQPMPEILKKIVEQREEKNDVPTKIIGPKTLDFADLYPSLSKEPQDLTGVFVRCSNSVDPNKSIPEDNLDDDLDDEVAAVGPNVANHSQSSKPSTATKSTNDKSHKNYLLARQSYTAHRRRELPGDRVITQEEIGTIRADWEKLSCEAKKPYFDIAEKTREFQEYRKIMFNKPVPK